MVKAAHSLVISQVRYIIPAINCANTALRQRGLYGGGEIVDQQTAQKTVEAATDIVAIVASLSAVLTKILMDGGVCTLRVRTSEKINVRYFQQQFLSQECDDSAKKWLGVLDSLEMVVVISIRPD